MEDIKVTKPLSAYGLFFRDKVKAVKQENSSKSVAQLSKIVASMWDALDEIHKEVYQRKSDVAKREYWRQVNSAGQQEEQNKITTSDALITQTDENGQQPQMAHQESEKQTEATEQQRVTSGTLQQIDVNDKQKLINQIAPSESQVDLPAGEDNSMAKCIRKKCIKLAIKSPDWNDEYCSYECVVIHCRDEFNHWIRSGLET